MALGISPKHIQEVPITEFTPSEFLVLAIEAAKIQKWDIGTIKENGFVAYSGFSFSSHGEEIKTTLNGENAIIKSECVGGQILDYGKNKRNVTALISTIEGLKSNFTKEELSIKFEEIKNSFSKGDENILDEGSLETKSKVSSFLSIFKPTKDYL